MHKLLLGIALAFAVIAAALGIVIGGGVYNVAADDAHTPFIYNLLETARDRSIARHAADLKIPDLNEADSVRRGAGNYDSMCVGCHLGPGARQTELSRGLYPRPPNLSKPADFDPARAFWTIKHGIKSTGMPAWGKSMEDQYIWDMVAFIRQLPTMDADQYAAAVEASEGHSHGGGESGDHEHDDEAESSEPHQHSHADGGSASHTHDDSSGRVSGVNSGDVVRVVKDFHSALAAGDERAVSRLLDSSVLIMEGGNVERSLEEYASHHLKADAKFMRSMKYQLERQSGDSVGDLAWVASEAALEGESKGKRLDLVSTESLVLRRTSAGWRIVHIHWSSRDRGKA